ncbi:MAG: hypothetical protein ACLSU9_11040 [Anaerovoracaceae bacterium]
MIEYKDSKYELRYTIKRIEMIEAAIGKPLLSVIISNNGIVSISELKALYIHGLRKEDGSYAGEKIANESFENVMNKMGYAALLEQIINTVQRDCPFFFPAD